MTHPTVLPIRDRIVQTAHELFYRDGVRATGVDKLIAAAGVTKVTFYRHFPSKNELILAFLDYRHQRWMDWFRDALQRHGGAAAGSAAVLAALGEWLQSPDYRGCAFINSTVELGGSQPEVLAQSRQHKGDMQQAIAAILPDTPRREDDALAMVIAVDGAIVRSQYDDSPQAALHGLGRLLDALRGAGAGD